MQPRQKPTPPRVVRESSIQKTSRGGVQFTLHHVQPAKEPRKEIAANEAFSKLMESPLEACSFGPGARLVQQDDNVVQHPLIISAYLAYAEHRPLVISPDAVWITIAQGLGHHVNLNPEAYRKQLVGHEHGKKTICVETGSSPDWPSVFEAFCDELSKDQKCSEMAKWAQPTFTTTGPAERAAFQVVLMDILKPYHNFVVRCICGIPSIELLGTPQDWQDIESRIGRLDEFGLEWWTQSLKPICRQFVEASDGRIDLKHWAQIVKKESTYGTELIDGWLVKLVPYIVGNRSGHVNRQNPLLLESRPGKECRGISPSSLPKGVSQVPFVLKDEQDGTICSKEFIAGLAGIQQRQGNGALEARIGWAIRPRSGLSVALDELEHRGLLEGARAPVDNDFRSMGAMASEVFQIQDRCNGATLCTKQGRVCGRLYPFNEHVVTRYIQPENERGHDESKQEAVFQTKRLQEWKCVRTARHPKFGYSVSWRGIGELDGKTIAIQVNSRGGNTLLLFDRDELAVNPEAYEVRESKDLGALILETLNRQ